MSNRGPRLTRLTDQSSSRIEDAVWEEVGQEPFQPRKPTWWESAPAGVKLVLVFVPLFMLGMCMGSLPPPTEEVEAESGVSGQGMSDAELAAYEAKLAAEEAMAAAKAAQEAAGATPKGKSQIIDNCRRLEACGFYKILRTEVVEVRGDERLVKATLQGGETPDAQGDRTDIQRIVWDSRPGTFYALCSQARPRVSHNYTGNWMVDEFDFSRGDLGGVPGYQQDSAKIYQALCHGFFRNELAEQGGALGYQSPPDGYAMQFSIESPSKLMDF